MVLDVKKNASSELVEAGCASGLRTWSSDDQALNFGAGTFRAKETQDNAESFFGHDRNDAGLCGQPSTQLVHLPRLSRLLAGSLPHGFILVCRRGNYKRAAALTTSIASQVLHQCKISCDNPEKIGDSRTVLRFSAPIGMKPLDTASIRRL
jgi:hypothetical protein